MSEAADPLSRVLRTVSAALNIVLPPRVTPYVARLSAQGRWSSYFPNQRLVMAAEAGAGASDPEATTLQILDRALLSLSDSAKSDCRAAVVGWVDADGVTAGAALELRSPGKRVILAGSWLPRHLWLHPVPDPDQSPEYALNKAIDLLKHLAAHQGPRDIRDVQGAMRLCEACFRYARGISPAPATSLPADDRRQVRWLADFIAAAEAERLRLFPREVAQAAPEPRASGVLAGARVFLSYAMPTNVQLARPLKRALESHGASVWFDQTERPEIDELAVGLNRTIAAHDVFLLCASRELFENAGYALQELAWVLNLQVSGAWRGAICVAELDDVVLPRAFEHVPRVALSDLEVARWPEAIANLVVRARNEGAPVITVNHVAVDRPVALLRELGLDELRLRARYVSAWWRVDEQALVRALSEGSAHAIQSPEYQSLCNTIHALRWDGALATYDSWPPDPAVRDIRVRLGALKALFQICAIDRDTRLPKNELNADVAFLAGRPLPLIAEPAVIGWDDEERRFSVRHHLGVLATIEHVMRRGLAARLLLDSSLADRGQWDRAIRERRRECVDCLLNLRAQGRNVWSGARPIAWDAAHHALSTFLYHGTEQWSPVPPDWVRLAVVGARSDLSAFFADVTWRTSRTGEPVQRTFDAPTIDGPVRFVVACRESGATRDPIEGESGPTIALAVTLVEKKAELMLNWASGALHDGAALATAPLTL